MPLALTQPYGLDCGLQEPFVPPKPAAGGGLTFTVDGTGARRLQSLVFTLVTDANVASRYVTVEYVGRNGLSYAVAAVTATQAASLTNRYVFGVGYGASAFNTGTDGFAPLPDVFLMPGDQLKILIGTVQVADQLSLISGVMERFPLDGRGLPNNRTRGG